ncbi:unnamed protein product [Brassicogethes aeneus]|uniref:peptidylprolyl isomerase n=1 Tax=Brassicogethes aeneus TaxID=1431903 RepID=A0A9P0BCF8_BRAAE|nr:unnamed protein product [Brassicogethes aeneus]
MSETTEINPYVFLDVSFGAAKAGRIVIELYENVVPKTVRNFRSLCTGMQISKCTGKPMHYKGTKFHRVVPQFLAQAGDVTEISGQGGESIYGQTFDDENFKISHNTEGMVGMANNGPNTNSSQFYITTVPCSHLDGRNVAFGRVVKGLNIVIEMGDIARNNETPTEDITITDCGEYEPGEPFNIEECDETEDKYPPWPNDWDVPGSEEKTVLDAIEKIKNSGSHFFYKSNFTDSERKYKKALRYIDWYLLESDGKSNCDLEKTKLTLLLNLATVKQKMRKYKEVVQLCSQVIESHPGNGKAYYRRAQARLGSKDYDKALDDLNTAITLHPNDKNIQDFLELTKKTKLVYLKQEKKVFSRLFQ